MDQTITHRCVLLTILPSPKWPLLSSAAPDPTASDIDPPIRCDSSQDGQGKYRHHRLGQLVSLVNPRVHLETDDCLSRSELNSRGSAIARITGQNVKLNPNEFDERVRMWVYEEDVCRLSSPSAFERGKAPLKSSLRDASCRRSSIRSMRTRSIFLACSCRRTSSRCRTSGRRSRALRRWCLSCLTNVRLLSRTRPPFHWAWLGAARR